MKKILFLLAAIALLGSCAKEDFNERKLTKKGGEWEVLFAYINYDSVGQVDGTVKFDKKEKICTMSFAYTNDTGQKVKFNEEFTYLSTLDNHIVLYDKNGVGNNFYIIEVSKHEFSIECHDFKDSTFGFEYALTLVCQK